jgi:hypothetical protein
MESGMARGAPFPTRRLLAAAAFLAPLLAGSAGDAYLVRVTNQGEEIRWDLGISAPNLAAGEVTYFIDASGVPDISGAQFAAAVRASVQSWQDVPGSDIRFREDPARAASKKNASDKVNRFGFSPGVLPPFAFAACFTAVSKGRITDADVVFNPAPGTGLHWSVATPGTPSGADAQGIATHEWGHGIGLDHVPLFRSTMFFSASPGQISLRSLETDDAAAAAHSYPAPSLATGFATLRGRVDVAGTGDDRGIQVTALDVVSGFPAASSLSAPSGDWEIRGLPPGAYAVAASPIGSAAVEGGVYAGYWDSSVTGILPVVRGTDGNADGSTGILVLAGGEVRSGIDFAVATGPDPKEPNDATVTATPLPTNGSVGARIEDSGDDDYYSFAGTAGRTVSVFVHAMHLGSEVNARVYLRNDSGILLAANNNVSNALFEIEGPDADCRIVDFAPPSTGTYFVQVEAEQSVDPSRPADFFYVLSIFEGGAGVAHPGTSTFSASPPVAPGDGVSSSSLLFVPRTLQGSLLGPGLAVTFELVPDGDADGVLLPVIDQGTGAYTASLVAPAGMGGDVVRARVDGNAVTTAAVTWRGPADFDASEFLSIPRRIRFDGASTGLLSLFPRDGNGVAFGPGRSVSLFLPGGTDAGIGGTSDAGGGAYEALLTAGTTEGGVAVGASVDGQTVGGNWTVTLGFPLDAVRDDVAADLGAALLAHPPLPPKAATKVGKARDLLVAVQPLPVPAEALAVATNARKALAQMEGAAKKGAATTALSSELAEAVRQSAREAVDAASPLADTAKEQKALGAAEARLDDGDALLATGLWSKAAAKYRLALKSAAIVE